jgi:hypothetical protein
MNKKFLTFGILGIFALAFVSAVTYYSVFSSQFTVLPSILVSGDLKQELDGDYYSGEGEIRGELVTISNEAPSEREITISNNANNDTEVSYVSDLILTKKNVVFGEEPWTIPNEAETVKVRYTVIGDDFSADVYEGNRSDYTLVYYKDNSDRFNSPAKAILVSSVLDNLPYEDDNNTVNDYCSIENYTTCHGAKLWYVPTTAILSDGSLDWSRALNNEFYFETSLIQYNAEGNLILYPGEELEIIPIYVPSVYAEGTYTIETTIA